MKPASRQPAITFLAASTSLLLSLPALADQQSALPCSGYWMLESGQTMTIMGPGGGPGKKAFEMQVTDCGDTLVLYDFGGDESGERKVFQRSSRDPNTYHFSKTFHASAGGRSFSFPLTVRLSQQNPARMTVAWNFATGMATAPGTMTYQRPLPEGTMALLATECEDATEPGPGFDDPKTREQALALEREQQSIDVLLSVMREHNLTPPADSGLDLRDYLSVSSASDGSNEVQIKLLRADDGSLLPDPTVFSIDYNRCVVDEREYKSVDDIIYFEVIPLLDEDPDAAPTDMKRVTRYDDGTQTVSRQPLRRVFFTHATVTDAGTGKLTRAADVGDSQALGRRESISAAWEALGVGAPRLDDGFADE